jgi:hypothetical protein
LPVPLPPPAVTVTVSPIFPDPVLKVSVACTESATPIVTEVVAVFVSDPIVTDAVIVNNVAAVTVVGVPEIVPVAVSKSRPAGSEPLTANELLTPASATTVTLIGVIATPTASVVVEVDDVRPGFVVNVAVVIDGPAPAALFATTSAVYWVPGCSPVTFALVVTELAVTADPELTGVKVTVYESIDSPPLEVGAVIAIVAVVVAPIATLPEAAAGAVGTEYVTPRETVVDAVCVSPAISTAAVIVYVADVVTAVGVPEIVPVAVSKVSPAGSVPVSA